MWYWGGLYISSNTIARVLGGISMKAYDYLMQMMRPGVVWFNETLPNDLLESIDDWIDQGPIDLCLVIGTTGQVWPAAGYIGICKGKGAKVAVINMEIDEDPHLGGVNTAYVDLPSVDYLLRIRGESSANNPG